MEARKPPYARMIFVCTNAREGGKIACANPGRGGDTICEALKQYVKQAGLKGKVRVARSGCMDLCAQGPNLMVWPDGIWYSGVGESDLPDIIAKHLEPLRKA